MNDKNMFKYPFPVKWGEKKDKDELADKILQSIFKKRH